MEPTKYERRKYRLQGVFDEYSKLIQFLHHSIVHPIWVRTPLTDPLTTRKEWKEFTLEPETVAEAIVAQLLKGESGQLILPSRFGFAGGIRGWPSWLQEVIRGQDAIPDLPRPSQ